MCKHLFMIISPVTHITWKVSQIMQWVNLKCFGVWHKRSPFVAVSQPDDSLVRRLMIVISSHGSPLGMIKCSPCVRPSWNIWVTVSSISSTHCQQRSFLDSHQGCRWFMIESSRLLGILFRSYNLLRPLIDFICNRYRREVWKLCSIQIEPFYIHTCYLPIHILINS